jgi:hypothetical protein
MTTLELNEIAEQRMSDPAVAGRLVTNLRSSEQVEQRENDGRKFGASWLDLGDFWRCVVSDAATMKLLVQVDLHENGTARVEVMEPCRVTVSPEEGILCLTRYK